MATYFFGTVLVARNLLIKSALNFLYPSFVSRSSMLMSLGTVRTLTMLREPLLSTITGIMVDPESV